jgi:hypothetical protein
MQRTIFFTALFAAAVSSGFGNCSRSMESACGGYFVEIREQIVVARNTLSEEGRKLASEVDREQWMEWSVDRLKETQRFIDAAGDDPAHAKAGRELNEAANSLVEFFGHAKRGSSRDMVSALKKVELHGENARRLACSSK